ncbi:MAG: glycine cleavage system protein GcvH [Spirochaetales bacterium]|jgi:glycine cleavage system H protein|nr:glycine cleavage system protein GcvH [Spirochaetales bacterium]
MDNYLYSKDHEWVLQQDGRAKVGISEIAQSELGDISFVELPEVGRQVSRGEAVCSIDSLKSTSEIYAPVSGTILEVNEGLADEQACTIINSDPLGQGWLFVLEMSDPKEIEELLTRSEYEHYLESG